MILDAQHSPERTGNLYFHAIRRKRRSPGFHPPNRAHTGGAGKTLVLADDIRPPVPPQNEHSPSRPQVREHPHLKKIRRQTGGLWFCPLLRQSGRPTSAQPNILRLGRLRCTRSRRRHTVQSKIGRRLVPRCHSVHHADRCDALQRQELAETPEESAEPQVGVPAEIPGDSDPSGQKHRQAHSGAGHNDEADCRQNFGTRMGSK